MKYLALAVVAALLAAGGCSRKVDNQEAVRQAVLDYLAKKNLNVSAMQVDITSVSFRENEADATVSFRGKDTPAGQTAAGMTMSYTLTKQGNAWVVKGRTGATTPDHAAAAGTAAPGAADASSMPPGHPQTSSPMGAVPQMASPPPAGTKK